MEFDKLTFAKLIADDTRQEIIDQLCCVWLSVNDLVDRLGGKVNQPTVSHHLKKLEEAGLLRVRQEGRQRFYTLDEEYMTLCCCLLANQSVRNFKAQIVPIDSIEGGQC